MVNIYSAAFKCSRIRTLYALTIETTVTTNEPYTWIYVYVYANPFKRSRHYEVEVLLYINISLSKWPLLCPMNNMSRRHSSEMAAGELRSGCGGGVALLTCCCGACAAGWWSAPAAAARAGARAAAAAGAGGPTPRPPRRPQRPPRHPQRPPRHPQRPPLRTPRSTTANIKCTNIASSTSCLLTFTLSFWYCFFVMI